MLLSDGDEGSPWQAEIERVRADYPGRVITVDEMGAVTQRIKPDMKMPDAVTEDGFSVRELYGTFETYVEVRRYVYPLAWPAETVTMTAKMV
jgi:hypothetical protein